MTRRCTQQAQRKFARFAHVTILQGDSAAVLPEVLKGLSEPCLFWLDGHFSGGITAKSSVETPIFQELAAILGHPVEGHVILIDDARAFTGQDGYPTLAELKNFIDRLDALQTLHISDDVIRIHA